MNYAFQTKHQENIAKAYGSALSISTKKSIEICNSIRGKPVQKAKNFLEAVIKKEKAVPIKRFGRDTAHKKEIGAGKFPIVAADQTLKLIQSAESNAQNKGLDVKKLVIEHINANKASQPWHYGRKRRSRMKRTHIQIVLKEDKK